jgi:hypothetical protein
MSAAMYDQKSIKTEDLNMKKVLLWFAGAMLLSAGAHALPITYNISRSVSAGTITGTIKISERSEARMSWTGIYTSMPTPTLRQSVA